MTRDRARGQAGRDQARAASSTCSPRSREQRIGQRRRDVPGGRPHDPLHRPIADGQVKVNRATPRAAGRASSGTLTLTYGGDSDTQPYTVKLLATRRGASLKAKRPTHRQGPHQGDRAAISKRARGSVRVELRFQPAGADAAARRRVQGPHRQGPLQARQAPIRDVLRDIAGSPAALGSYVVFAGDKRSGIAGQSAFFELPPPR